MLTIEVSVNIFLYKLFGFLLGQEVDLYFTSVENKTPVSQTHTQRFEHLSKAMFTSVEGCIAVSSWDGDCKYPRGRIAGTFVPNAGLTRVVTHSVGRVSTVQSYPYPVGYFIFYDIL